MNTILRQPWRTLVVDDDIGVRTAVASVVSAAGHEPLLAGSCAEAWDHLKSGPIQATFIDLNIRAESGLDLASVLLARSQIRVILMSGALTPRARARALSLGVRRILEKPLTLEVLREILRLHLPPGGSPFSPVPPVRDPGGLNTVPGRDASCVRPDDQWSPSP